MPKPTKESIEARARYIGTSLKELPYTATSGGALTVTSKGWWGPYRAKVGRGMNYHQLKYADEISPDPDAPAFPSDWNIIISNTAQAKPQQALDQVFMGDPIITAKTMSKAEGVREIEKRIAKYLMGQLQDEERQSDISPLQDQAAQTLWYGLAARMDILDIKRWPEKPKGPKRAEDGKKWAISPAAHKKALAEYDEKRRGKSPFVTRTLSPLAIAYDRVNTPIQWLMLQEPIMPWDARELYPTLELPDTVEAENVKALCWTRYWTPEWYACYVDGEPALEGADGVVENPYGFIPIYPSGGGFGELDPAGRPEVELGGLMDSNIDLFRMETILTNTLMVYARRAGFGPKVFIMGTGDDTEAQERIEAQIMRGPERVVFLPDNVTADTFDPSPLPQAVVELRAQTMADIDRGITYDVSAGNPNPAQSGISRQIVQQQSGKRVTTTALHISQSIEAWCQGRIRMIREVLKESVSGTYGSEMVELDWEELPDDLTFKCDLLTDSAADKARKVQEGLALRGTTPPTISRETNARDYLQLENPEAEERTILEEAIYDQVIVPMVLQVLQGQGPALIAAAAEAAGIQTEAPPGGGNTQESLRVGPVGAMLPGEAHNPENDAGFTPERAAMEERQKMGTNHVRVVS